jgi:hypothetical protein
MCAIYVVVVVVVVVVMVVTGGGASLPHSQVFEICNFKATQRVLGR